MRRACAFFEGWEDRKKEKEETIRTSLKGSKTIPESLSAAPAALVTVAESLPLRRGAEERRGPTMPATMVVAEREVEEEVEVERLMFFFFFVERDPCESLILSKMLQSPPRASQAGSRGWRREDQLKPREQSRRDGSEQMSPSVLDVAALPTQKKKKNVCETHHRAQGARFSPGRQVHLAWFPDR